MTQPSSTQQAEPKSPPSKEPAQPTMWVFMFAVLFMAILLPRVLRRLRRTRPVDPPGTFDRPGSGPRDELERLLTDIQDLTRERIAQLDTKIRMLNQLLLECDQKKGELEKLLGRAPRESAPAPAAPPPRPANPLHDQVYSLQDSGKELLDICAATGLEKGEVELILGLRKMPPGRA